MRSNISEEIEIPTGVAVEIKENKIFVKKEDKENFKDVPLGVDVKKKENRIVINYTKANKKQKAFVFTLKAHIKNMFRGLDENFIYKLEICSVHFPITVNVDKPNKQFIIKNFLGEKKERKANIIGGTDVKVEQNIITVQSKDKEEAGQTAANIETATKIKGRDRRIFQDGIFITEKCEKKI